MSNLEYYSYFSSVKSRISIFSADVSCEMYATRRKETRLVETISIALKYLYCMLGAILKF